MDINKLETLRLEFIDKHNKVNQAMIDMVKEVIGDEEFTAINDDGAINMLYDMLDDKQKKIIDYVRQKHDWAREFFNREFSIHFFKTVTDKQNFDNFINSQTKGADLFIFCSGTLNEAYDKTMKDIEYFITNGKALVKMAKLHKYVTNYCK